MSPVQEKQRFPKDCHCEHSEAIHRVAALDCFVGYARLAMMARTATRELDLVI